MLADYIESLGRIAVGASYFGNEQRIVDCAVLCCPVDEPFVLKIGSKQVD